MSPYEKDNPIKTKPFWKRLNLYFNCTFKTGHTYFCVFSASGGQAHYDSLYICGNCGHKKWYKTSNWVNH
jgi:hypothetical protein